MNMHEFQRRLHLRFGSDPTLRLVRKLTAVAIGEMQDTMADQTRGWFIWTETADPTIPGGG